MTGRFFVGGLVGMSLSLAYTKQNGHELVLEKVEKGYAFVEDVFQTLADKGKGGK